MRRLWWFFLGYLFAYCTGCAPWRETIAWQYLGPPEHHEAVAAGAEAWNQACPVDGGMFREALYMGQDVREVRILAGPPSRALNGVGWQGANTYVTSGPMQIWPEGCPDVSRCATHEFGHLAGLALHIPGTIMDEYAIDLEDPKITPEVLAALDRVGWGCPL